MMRGVQWGKTGAESGSQGRRDGYRWGSPGMLPGLPLRVPDRIVWPRGEEDVLTVDVAKTHVKAPGASRFAFLWPLLWLIWLPNLIPPFAALLHAHPTAPRLGAAVADLALFVAVYIWASWQNGLSRAVYPLRHQQAQGRWNWIGVAVLAGLSAALVLSDGPRWLVLLIFVSACVGGRFALGRALRAVAAIVLLTGLLGLLTHDSVSDFGPALFWTGMAGVLTIIVSYLRLTNSALHVAREENARLAVEAERLRFARDLHDLLGHDLARIALQSEVVEALVHTNPERAAATAREIGEAARTALQEVRAAVAGYRQRRLASELRGAGEILAAAGIAYQCEGERVAVPPAVEAVLAWAVREGVTNVVKHSRARHCAIRVTQGTGRAGVELIDDGRGADLVHDEPSALALGHGGSGLPGLSERVAALGGRCEATHRPGGGFRLSVTLPIEMDSAAERATVERAAVEQAVAVDTGGRP